MGALAPAWRAAAVLAAAVGGAELGGVAWQAPAAEQEEVVEEGRMLVEAHEREESVEDLVVDLHPVGLGGRRGEGPVEKTEEEEHEHAAGGAHA